MQYRINLTKNQSPSHSHKNYEVIVYTKGSGTVHTVGQNIEATEGKILIVPPGTSHGTTFTEGLERIYIQGDFNHIFKIPSPVLIATPYEHENDGILLARMIYENRYKAPEYLSALIQAFAHFLMQSLKIEEEIHIKIKEIIGEITSRFYDCDLRLHSLLQNSGYAVDYIRTQFKKITGKTPTDFLTEVRIQHACYLIDVYKKSLSLSEIAQKCGYTDYIYFSRRFKAIMGISPRAYRDDA